MPRSTIQETESDMMLQDPDKVHKIQKMCNFVCNGVTIHHMLLFIKNKHSAVTFLREHWVLPVYQVPVSYTHLDVYKRQV